MANFSAVVTARRALLPEDFLRGTLYATNQVHHSVTKAAVLAGFPASSVRVVPHTAELRMDVEALRELVAKDRADGREPFCVVASAGTTNTGAVDPIPELVTVRDQERLWLHVDGAYGGFFQLTERGRRLFTGIEQADSITLDPHKAMFLPYGTGALVVRDGERLHAAHNVEAEYLQDLSGDAATPNFAEYSPELSRDFRGLRVWLPLMLHGVDAFREALDEKLDLTRLLYDAVRAMPELEVPWEPEVTVVAFRLRNGDDEANRRFLDRINAPRRVFLSSTMIEGRFFLRACIVSHRTHRDRIEEAIDIIRQAAIAG
jgi:aromatic-L-amino-acid decarboxylase